MCGLWKTSPHPRTSRSPGSCWRELLCADVVENVFVSVPLSSERRADAFELLNVSGGRAFPKSYVEKLENHMIRCSRRSRAIEELTIHTTLTHTSQPLLSIPSTTSLTASLLCVGTGDSEKRKAFERAA